MNLELFKHVCKLLRQQQASQQPAPQIQVTGLGQFGEEPLAITAYISGMQIILRHDGTWTAI